ncbi:Cytochrome [Abeliophyllum distichum]|uniref:Cytochrome n=1 Tax=Abeliophyllum distichum TaxID=126358 RepID=A0ABD1Q4G0_9LAMI
MNGEGCDVGVEFMALTNNVISMMTMSTRCSTNVDETAQIRKIARGITQLSGLLSLGEAFILLKKLVDESDIPNLPYLHAVVKETLRLHPSLPLVFRKCREDCSIKGFPIAKNSRIAVNLYAINRDPNDWEDAAEFKPERFLINIAINAIGHADQEDMKVQNYCYVPFGGGRRGCSGANLAISLLHITLAASIQCFHWKIKGAEKVDMEEGAGFSVPMAHPLVCYPILRVNPSDLLMIN